MMFVQFEHFPDTPACIYKYSDVVWTRIEQQREVTKECCDEKHQKPENNKSS